MPVLEKCAVSLLASLEYRQALHYWVAFPFDRPTPVFHITAHAVALTPYHHRCRSPALKMQKNKKNLIPFLYSSFLFLRGLFASSIFFLNCYIKSASKALYHIKKNSHFYTLYTYLDVI